MTDTVNSRRTSRADKDVPAATGSDNPSGRFQPQTYLENRDGLPYMPLKWLLAWLRSEHPQAKINTDLVSHQQGVAIFKALVELPDGGSATGWGAQAHPESATSLSAAASGNLDYISSAENQALHRALAALGYGIEYAQDFDPPADHQPILLPEQQAYEAEDEPGIEVPMALPGQAEPDPSGAETAMDDRPAEAEPALAPTRGEQRLLREQREPLENRPARSAERSAAPPADNINSNPPQAAAPSNLTSPVVEDRLKNVRDDALRVVIKQIYTEARARFNIDEDRVDQRSRSRFTRPAYELDYNEAEQFLEAILSAVKRRT